MATRSPQGQILACRTEPVGILRDDDATPISETDEPTRCQEAAPHLLFIALISGFLLIQGVTAASSLLRQTTATRSSWQRRITSATASMTISRSRPRLPLCRRAARPSSRTVHSTVRGASPRQQERASSARDRMRHLLNSARMVNSTSRRSMSPLAISTSEGRTIPI